jgi:flagellar motor switch protein FliM
MQEENLITNEEMSALLDGPMTSGAQEKRKRVVPYNFRRPDRLSKEQIRALYLLHDMFSHTLSSSLPIFLRTISEVTLISIEQQAYVEYLQGLADPTFLFTSTMQPLQGTMAIEINPIVAFPIVDRMLGGAGAATQDTRAATEIELNITEGFLQLVIDDICEAWKPILEIDMQVVGKETRPQMLQIVPPNEVVISIVFHIQIGEARGTMGFCIPAIMLEPIMHKFNQSSYTRNRETPVEETRALLDTLSDVTFPVSAELERTTALMDDLLSLAPGDVLRLDHSIEKPLKVNVSGINKFHGELGAHNGRVVVLLTKPAENNR